MPQKRNPDVVELARGRCRELRGYAAMLQELASGLPSNYHRDLQLLKKPLFGRWHTAEDWLDVLIALVPALQVDAAACTRRLQRRYLRCPSGLPLSAGRHAVPRCL